jgi:N-acetylneuraminic acid mutarotase
MKPLSFTLISALLCSLFFSACGSHTTPPPPPDHANQWTWVSGTTLANQSGIYGTLGESSSNNIPGARGFSVSWVDTSGNFWLFGGFGLDSVSDSNTNVLNDMWEYSNSQWTWMGGSDLINQRGVYGTLGTSSANNIPGARQNAVSWTDTSGNLWLFGGFGLDSAGTINPLNDLWKYAANQWTWVNGAKVASQPGTYGTLGSASSSNVPGARYQAVSGSDSSGNLWLFGGMGLDSIGADGYLNDLWKFNAGQWTWVSGANVVNQSGTYGTLGATGVGNVPGARQGAMSWIDADGNFWLFGGLGYDSAGTLGQLNDLWEYSQGQWTWMAGANIANQLATYGTVGTAASGNTPGARYFSQGWTDSSGNLWLFGGSGLDSTGASGQLNDLWKYIAGQWVWMDGSTLGNQSGVYGTQLTPDSANIPGGRSGAVVWTDQAGNFWLFGGGTDSSMAAGWLSDLWEYQP